MRAENLISQPAMAKPAVGKDVDSWCTRCKLVLAHTIEAVSAGKITRVHCNTCKSQHAYRPNAPGGAARTRSSGGRKEGKAAPRDDYESLMRGKDPASARRYVLADRFSPNELIRHPQFGMGVVKSVKDMDKIEVAFADAVRTLIHGRRL
jgi:hypothetical protein